MLTFDGKDIYCGGTTNIRRRIRYHFWRLKRGKHKSTEVQELYDKSDRTKFGYRIIEYVNEKSLEERERYWTAQSDGLLNSMPLGQKWKDHTLAKKSAAAKRQMSDPEQYEAVRKRLANNAALLVERGKNDPIFAAQRRAAALSGGAAIKKKLKDPQKLKEHSDGLSKRWADPEYKAKLSIKLKAAWARRKDEL